MHNALPPPPGFHNPKAMIANPSTLNDQSWYADSGASHHCTPDVTNLQHSTDYHGQEHVYIGNGTGKLKKGSLQIKKWNLEAKQSKAPCMDEHAYACCSYPNPCLSQSTTLRRGNLLDQGHAYA
ncbi:hypothetical protein PIB30_077520 [Stylosanthes scabra]|uniref:Uncharacterized protein n=1 Tax=Stylosanthes scabra TaxID=79078 RepID=A0ABU6ZPB9_9FABA|nr:hypothetical protein [Stylosanthes scabra]